MIFFNKYPSAIYIKKNSLTFYTGDEEKNLELPVDIATDSDIINPQKYEKLVEDFIITEKIKKQQFILVLSEEIVFQKSVPPEDIKIADERLADFVSMIPLEGEKLVKKSVQVEGSIQLFAVNKHLFEKIIEILEKLRFEVVAVVPLSLFSSDNDFSKDTIKNIYKENELLKKANFLSDDSTHGNAGQSKMAFVVILFLIIVVLIMGTFLASAYFKLPLPFLPLEREAKLTKTALKGSPAPIGTESATLKDSTQSATLEKEKLKITVLNGTGIAGQASKIKDLLIEIGLSKIETGNAEGANAEETVVVFLPTVANSVREEIISVLKEQFATVSAQEEDVASGTDILITTGKPAATP